MAGLKDVIDYKYEVINAIANSQEIMGLMFDNPNIDMDDDLVYNVRNDNLVDHSFTDDTWTAERTAIFVECKMTDLQTVTVKEMAIVIQIISPNGYIKLDRMKFKKRKGNRNDNIAVAVANLLDGADCGNIGSTIGEIQLVESAPVAAPNGFSSVQLVFESENFR
mgnify:FL=1